MRPIAPRFEIVAGAVLLALVQGAAVKIPLQPGLRVVTALSDREGDYESIKTIDAVDANGVTISYSADIPSGQRGQPPRKVNTKRIVRRQDLDTAHEYMQVFSPSAPPTVAGTTAIGASSAVLTELKTRGQTAFTFQTPGRQPSMEKVLAALTGKADAKPGSLDDLAKQLDTSKASGTLTRVESGDVPFPVLVNGARTSVNAIHARGTFDDLQVEFYFLDDPGNPLALKWSAGAGTGTLQVVQIAYAAPSPAPIENALKESGRAEIHGIYFDFGSATIKPESGPVLKDIADTLAKNPAWKLSVEGHTDNVGGDAANLDLSKRRADAVKQALIATYHVEASRLTTNGFGASKPKEANDTAEGRARNRRVELVRQ